MPDFSALKHPTLEPPASEEAIAAVERELGFELPGALRALLRTADGWLDDLGVLFYGCEYLAERNATWEVSTYAPGYVAVADDSGGRVALVSRDPSSKVVFSSDCGDMDPSGFDVLADDLLGWVERGCPFHGSRWFEEAAVNEPVDVVLIRPLPNGVRDLMTLRRELQIERPIHELRQAVETLPCVLVSDRWRVSCAARLETLGELADVLELRSRNRSPR